MHDDEILAIRVLAMPADTNAHGTIFGGYVLGLIDQAGAVAAHAAGAAKVVTVSMREVVFKAPVHVGDSVSCYARVVSCGKTSVVTCVRVVAESSTARARGVPPRDVTEAEVVYVQVDEHGQPLPLRLASE
ncbi:MAG: acyl-CoA thioesterase [Deltaproteobacteria bacterium]|nr:acyl-CoA thioesterase [Deltaproteobacteria bacterium]